MAKTSLKVKAARKPKFKVRVASVAAVRTLSTKNLEFVASASVKWRTAANFQASQRQAGKSTNEKSPDKLCGY